MRVKFDIAESVEQFEAGLITAEELVESRPVIQLTVHPNDPEYVNILGFVQMTQRIPKEKKAYYDIDWKSKKKS